MCVYVCVCVCMSVCAWQEERKVYQKGVPTKEFAGLLEDADPKSAGEKSECVKGLLTSLF